MGSIGAPEILIVLLVALIVLGPERLPGAARQVGKVMGDLRRMSQGFQAEVRDAFNDAGPPPQPYARQAPAPLAKPRPLAVDPDTDGTVGAGQPARDDAPVPGPPTPGGVPGPEAATKPADDADPSRRSGDQPGAG